MLGHLATVQTWPRRLSHPNQSSVVSPCHSHEDQLNLHGLQVQLWGLYPSLAMPSSLSAPCLGAVLPLGLRSSSSSLPHSSFLTPFLSFGSSWHFFSSPATLCRLTSLLAHRDPCFLPRGSNHRLWDLTLWLISACPFRRSELPTLPGGPSPKPPPPTPGLLGNESGNRSPWPSLSFLQSPALPVTGTALLPVGS